MKVTSTTHLPAHAHIQFTDIGLEDLRLAADILPVLGEPPSDLARATHRNG
jgi:hypothetical protein